MGGVIVIGSNDSRPLRMSRWRRTRLCAAPARVLCEVWSFWVPPRGLSLSLCSLRLFLGKSAFPPFLGPAGGREHLVGPGQLCSRGQRSAEGSRWTGRWNHAEGCGGHHQWDLAGAQEPLQSHRPSWSAPDGVSRSLFRPGAPSASREPRVIFVNQRMYQKAGPDLALSGLISCGSGPCVCRTLVQSH